LSVRSCAKAVQGFALQIPVSRELGGSLVDLGPLVLDEQRVGQGVVPRRERWHAVDLDPAFEGVRLALVERLAVGGAAAVQPEDQVRHGKTRIVDRYDREVLARGGDAKDGVGRDPRLPKDLRRGIQDGGPDLLRILLTRATLGPLEPRSIERM
jgi:hypothetical protein